MHKNDCLVVIVVLLLLMPTILVRAQMRKEHAPVKFRKIYYRYGTTVGSTAADASWINTLPTTLQQE